MPPNSSDNLASYPRWTGKFAKQAHQQSHQDMQIQIVLRSIMRLAGFGRDEKDFDQSFKIEVENDGIVVTSRYSQNHPRVEALFADKLGLRSADITPSRSPEIRTEGSSYKRYRIPYHELEREAARMAMAAVFCELLGAEPSRTSHTARLNPRSQPPSIS